jgi:hypothetical protein
LTGDDEIRNENDVHLQWRDYLAITIASFETTLLPILVTVLVLLLVVLLLRL